VAPFVSGTGCRLLIVGQTQPGSACGSTRGDSAVRSPQEPSVSVL